MLFCVWFSISLAYYGISLSIADLSGNRFFGFMLGGVLELAAFLLTYLSLRVVGRRTCLVTYLFLSGVLLIATVATERLLRTDVISVPALVTSLALLEGRRRQLFLRRVSGDVRGLPHGDPLASHGSLRLLGSSRQPGGAASPAVGRRQLQLDAVPGIRLPLTPVWLFRPSSAGDGPARAA